MECQTHEKDVVKKKDDIHSRYTHAHTFKAYEKNETKRLLKKSILKEKTVTEI